VIMAKGNPFAGKQAPPFGKKGAKPNPFAKKGAKPNPFAKSEEPAMPAFKKGGKVKK